MKLVIDFILIIGVLLNLIALIGLFRLKQKKLPQNILIVFWFLILSIFVFFYADLHKLRTLQFIANFFQDGVRFLIPPLVLLYIKSIFRKEFQPN